MSRGPRLVWSGVAVVLAVLVVTGGRAILSPDGYKLTATFDDVGDLVSQHAVQIADVRVGQIANISLTDDFRAEVTLRIDPDIKVPKGSTAVLRTTSLLGEKFIELRPPSPDAFTTGPYLSPGDRITKSEEAPELEFVADTLIELLGAVEASDVASLVEVGASGFGGEREALRSIITDLTTVSGTLAERSEQIVRIVDRLDTAASSLGAGSGGLQEALSHLATTTGILFDNRDRAVEALKQLSRLAAAQNTVVVKHFDAVKTQIAQADAILGTLANSQEDVKSLLDWLERFVVAGPEAIPRDFTIVYLEGVLRGSGDD
ncbi:MAG TPA: MlaD family protein [Acidimicrobiia bacterium]|nr:MlaD family protein [Acidimicrobiia bacterium]